MYRSLLLFLCCLSCVVVSAQHTQALRGRVTDKETKAPLTGVVVSLPELTEAKGSVTNDQGIFHIEGIPVGKHTVFVSFPGYRSQALHNILFTTGKEVVLDIALEESVHIMEEVQVRTRREHINEMAIVSARTFDVQETERYAGSRGDPARMASNFAGVQGADDSRNDIIIRGNSPQGLLWRIEDMDIPNPNHFAIPGTTGGPVTMLNNRTLANSEFFTGAFPAEYGNSIAGVFDLKMRNGNNKRYEASFQLGFLGTEMAVEGPLSATRKSSFLLTYRYSTLQLFEGLNIKIGTSSVPNYQDATLRLNFPMGKGGNLSVFGIGGLSKINLIVSDLTEPSEEIYGDSDRDQYFRSNTGIVGMSYSQPFGSNVFSKLVVGYTANEIGSHHDKVFRNNDYAVDSLKNILDYRFVTRTTTAHWYVNRKWGARHTLKAGIVHTLYSINYIDSSRQFPPTRQEWQHRIDHRDETNITQPYVQYKLRPNDRLTLTAGLHGQYFSLNRSYSIEPRLAGRYRVQTNSAINIGYGLHSRLQPLYQYFAHLPQYDAKAMHNQSMGFTRSHHVVAGYEHVIGNMRFRTEAYYQYLFEVPVEQRSGSSFSGLNLGASFNRHFSDTLINAGTGYNYGLELTAERTFSKGYYFLFTGSLFRSMASGNDGVYRSTDYDSRFATNLLAGYERKAGKNSTFITGLKLTWAGGKRYSPPDPAASSAMGDFVAIDSLRNTLQFPDYFRADIKVGIRINTARVTHEIALDLVNVFNTKNILALTYSSELAERGAYPFVREYQLGFLPLFYYRIDFGLSRRQVQADEPK